MQRASLPPLLICLGLATAPAGAADVTAIMPVVTALPGQTVQVPITLDHDLAGLNVYSIELRFPFSAPYVSNANWLPTGVVMNWGAPYTNSTDSFAALATFGVNPITSTSTQLATLDVAVSPSAPDPSSMPLTLSIFRLNGTVPTTTVSLGLLLIRTEPVDVGDESMAGLALYPPAPSPARAPTRVAFELPAAGPARLAVFGTDGRRLRALADGSLPPGRHHADWDLADDSGRPVPAGLYFLRLDWNGRFLARRVAVVR